MRRLAMVLLVLSIVLPGCAKKGDTDAESQAEESSMAWLELVDAGDYTASWEEAAGYFKGAVNRETWRQTVSAVRQPLGPVLSRQLRSKAYTTTLPGAPDGEYVVLEYDTVFENKEAAVETITPMKDEDGEWRVSGYYIK
jgi:hypothetical protein